ncbi:MAG: hypothetical protein WA989_14375, partial [Henriciella sp.]|uniref:hypothetical protein n=1 Tax=Henriciella sp. TaxID=1968823 RepID=UPI003C70A648
VFERAFGNQSIVWPSFVLMDGEEVEVTGTGLGGWHKIESRVRYGAHRVERLTEAGRLCRDRFESPKCA